MNYMNYGAPPGVGMGGGPPGGNQPSFTTDVWAGGSPQQQVANNAYMPQAQQMQSSLSFQNPQMNRGNMAQHTSYAPDQQLSRILPFQNPQEFRGDPTVGSALLSQEYQQGLVPAGASTQAAMPPSVVQSTPQPQYQQGQVTANIGSQAGNASNVAAGTVQSLSQPQYQQGQVSTNTGSQAGNTSNVAPGAVQSVAPGAINQPTAPSPPQQQTILPTAINQPQPAYQQGVVSQTPDTSNAPPPGTVQRATPSAETVQSVSTGAHDPTQVQGTVPTGATAPNAQDAGTVQANQAQQPQVQTIADNAITPQPVQEVADNAHDPFAADTSGQPISDPNVPATQIQQGVVPDNASTQAAMPTSMVQTNTQPIQQTQQVADNAYDPTATPIQTQQVAGNAYDPTATVDNSAAANAYAAQDQSGNGPQDQVQASGPGIDPLIDPKRYGESTALAMDPILDYTGRLEEPLIGELESNLGTPNYNFTEAGNNSLLTSLEQQYRYDGAAALGKTALTQDPGDLQSALLGGANRIDDANPYDTRRDDIIAGQDSEVDRMYDKEFERIQNQFAVNNNLGSPAYTQALQDMNDQKAQAKLGIRSEFGQSAAATDESMASGRLADVTSAIGTSRSGEVSEEAIQANRRAGAQATGGYMGTTEFDQDLRGSALEEGVRRGRAHDVGQGLERERGHVDRQMMYQQQLQQQANEDYYRNLKAEEDAMYRPFQYQDAGLALGGGALGSPGTNMGDAASAYGGAAAGFGEYNKGRAGQLGSNWQSFIDTFYNKTPGT